MRRILVTSALPYANGPLHLGHILEAVQTDVWVRFQRLRGHEAYYVCAEDTHGTPIMLRAEADGVAPQDLIERMAREHHADYQDFLVQQDNFHSTHSAENRALTYRIFLALESAGHIVRRNVRQAYDESRAMFLPDRYVRGTCPVCGTKDQYGDSCENCGATYSPADLIDPVSVLSGTRPVERESEHLFFRLGDFARLLHRWVRSGAVQPGAVNKLEEWFQAGLQDWDISREKPYFGFEIPGAPGKYFYVWLDAPIGYIASFQEYAARHGLDTDQWWGKDSDTELYHFIGKDILYFHTLFWPAVLAGAQLRLPSGVHVHGFLTVNGQKMSKSRGTFITARDYLERAPAEALRYYFCAKLTPGLDDLDLSLEDFVARVNSDVVGKLVNIASRCGKLIAARSGGRLADAIADASLFDEFVAASPRIADAYEAKDYALAVREVMALADRANQYLDLHKPWNMPKDPMQADGVRAVCTQGLNLFRVLIGYLKPILPATAERAEAFLGAPIGRWSEIGVPILSTRIKPYTPLFTRLDPKVVGLLVGGQAGAAQPAAAPAATAAAPVAAEVAKRESAVAPIAIEEFQRLDLRVARIESASYVDGADKLLRLTVSLGSETRTIFAGIRSAYDPATLTGRHVVVVANLHPRRMRFGVSEGMVLAAGPGGSELFLVSPDAGATAGMQVK
jgi:methionyl-tRNA synthetase